MLTQHHSPAIHKLLIRPSSMFAEFPNTVCVLKVKSKRNSGYEVHCQICHSSGTQMKIHIGLTLKKYIYDNLSLPLPSHILQQKSRAYQNEQCYLATAILN